MNALANPYRPNLFEEIPVRSGLRFFFVRLSIGIFSNWLCGGLFQNPEGRRGKKEPINIGFADNSKRTRDSLLLIDIGTWTNIGRSMPKKKAKRYSQEEKEEILSFVENFGRGGQTAAVKKYKVSPISIGNWRKNAGLSVSTKGGKAGGKPSKELANVQALAKILVDLQEAEARVESLKKQYKAAKAKL